MEGKQDLKELAQLVRKAAIVLNQKVRTYKFDEVETILQSEFPIDTAVTDTEMSVLGLACSLNDSDEDDRKQNNQLLIKKILDMKPDINYTDKFQRTALHMAA